jgi:hypothetical protein
LRENDISAPASMPATRAYIGHNIASKEMMGSSGPVGLFGHVCGGAWDKRTAMIASFLLFFPSPVVMDRTVPY